MKIVLIILLLSLSVITINQNLNSKSNYLDTGWYYINSSESGLERELFGTKEIYFIDPTPIVTYKNFVKVEIYKSIYGDIGLSIQLDSTGTDKWSYATKHSISKKLALIIDDTLYHNPRVNAQITKGITALNRGDITKAELERLKAKLVNQ